MALGYTIAAILKRSSHVLSDERVCVKIDWLEQLNRHYVQVKLILPCVSLYLHLPCLSLGIKLFFFSSVFRIFLVDFSHGIEDH